MNGLPTLWTLGHSTLDIEAFLELLEPHRIEAVADVRRFPGSRRHPHFASGALRESLTGREIEYQWLSALGGRRSAAGAPSADSGWRHAAFRAYAAHLETAEFRQGIGTLLDLASRRRTALLCSEAVWWRCHRRLIADVLVSRGHEVLHIFPDGRGEPHRIREPAPSARRERRPRLVAPQRPS